jgi:Leucine-rich repeat (LRR) protein
MLILSNLRRNQLSSLPANLFQGLNLKTVNLGANLLTENSFPANLFQQGMTFPQNSLFRNAIYLENNKMTSIPNGLFTGLYGLEEL